jgi:voltage-gated potassium channel
MPETTARYTPTEAESISVAREALLKPLAEARRQSTEGRQKTGAKLAPVSEPRSRDAASVGVGYGRLTLTAAALEACGYGLDMMFAMTRLQRWEKLSEWPLAVLAVVFLAAYAYPILHPDLGHAERHSCDWLVYATWALFFVDFVIRVVLAERRARYVGYHFYDVVILAVPVLRPLRLLRLLVLLRFLNRRAADSLRGRVAVYVSMSAALVIFCAALAVLDAERGHRDANITSFGDAIWWATTTVTTVGYGDHYPVTTEGRYVAVALMIAGVALIGVVTASFASWLIDRVRQVEEESRAASAADLQLLRDEIASLRAELTTRR